MEYATFNPGFPVYIYEEGMDLPKQGTYFLVSGNGLWLHKDTGICRAFVPVDNISVLQELDAEAWVECRLPKLPAKYVYQIKNFFKRVVERYHSEAMTTEYFNKEDGTFKVHIPEQKVSAGGVQYRRAGMTGLEGMENYLPVMTIHSHCDFAAFHSGTDIGDEEDFDGIHCTFGHNNRDEFSIAASVVVNGHRLRVDPMKVLEGIEPTRVEQLHRGRECYYRLADVSDEQKIEWEEPIYKWFTKVSLWSPFVGFNRGIRKGDKVTWAGDLKTVSFKTMCGEGPFTVNAVDGEHITINTKVGLARFSEKLFRRLKDGEANEEN